MLTVRCARCKRKLLRYEKIGEGRLLRCHKARITRIFEGQLCEAGLLCPCGSRIGSDQGDWIDLFPGRVVTTGTRST
jgi:DNA-directed RNA polymerase subunit RPC12/RpoP